MSMVFLGEEKTQSETTKSKRNLHNLEINMVKTVLTLYLI